MQTSFSLFVCLAFIASAFAHIASVSVPSPYHATSSSSLPITFQTFNGPTTQEDFTLVLGLKQTGIGGDTALGTPLKVYDLVAQGHSSTGTGNFTLTIPLHKNKFSAGAGSYTIVSCVTRAFGAAYNAQMDTFTANFTVTI